MEDVESDRRVEALFEHIDVLATYVVDGNTAMRYRSSALEEALARTW